jgi:hypothetical protein
MGTALSANRMESADSLARSQALGGSKTRGWHLVQHPPAAGCTDLRLHHEFVIKLQGRLMQMSMR